MPPGDTSARPDHAAAASPSAVDRVPPNSLEAERGVLGSILLDAQRVFDLAVERQTRPEFFYAPAHQRIFHAMLQMHHAGMAIDLLTLSDHLRSHNLLEAVGGPLALDQLVDATPTAAHAEFYLDIVRQKFLLRRIIQEARNAESACFASDDPADVLVSRVEQAFLDITQNQHGAPPDWPALVTDTMNHIEDIVSTHKGGNGQNTGFLNIDTWLQGMHPGNMIVIAARPSMGKTSLAMNIAENVALGKGDRHGNPVPVAIFSLEMSYQEITMRLLCSHAEVSSATILGGHVSPQSHARLVQAADLFMKAPIHLDDTAGLDVVELRARARRIHKRATLGLVVIDYLQLLNSYQYVQQGRNAVIQHVSGEIKAMAKELQVPVIVLSQLNRQTESRELGKPRLSDLRESGSIEQDADVVLLLRRPCKYSDDENSGDRTLAIVDIAKHRNGRTHEECRLNFEDDYTRFRDRHEGVDGIPEPAFPHGEEEP